MSRFKRNEEPEEIEPEPEPVVKTDNWGRKIVKVTEREREVCNYHIAKKMIECFQYRRWMSNDNVIGPNGERIRPQ